MKPKTKPKSISQKAAKSHDPPILLTIGGSDSGGAAGIQADLKTFTALRVYGMSVLTAITAQNSVAVRAVHPLPAELVAAQLDAVLGDYGAAAIKTGFIGRPDLIETIAAKLREYRQPDGRPFLLVDPVLVNHRGQSMFGPKVVAAYRDQLFPLADLITPNRHEAALLSGRPLPSLHQGDELAAVLKTAGAQRILLTGVPDDAEIVDVFIDDRKTTYLSQPLLKSENRHGSGDTLSAAICAFVAQGNDLITAVNQAQQFTHQAMRRSAGWKLGAGHGPLSHW
jgi:hydroxymethylpyrimidine/phosphomethylpyrimidine kinase